MISSSVDPTTYEALSLFRERCLHARRSLVLSDDHPLVHAVWQQERARELVSRFIDSPDQGSRSFFEKLSDQLADATPGAMQLMVDLTWLHLVVSVTYKASTKREILAKIAGMGTGARLPEGVADTALDYGIVAPGTSFSTRRPNQLWLLIRFAEGWLTCTPVENVELLADPWRFRDFVFSLDGVADQTQRHALLHLVHPETFEDITSQFVKRRIVRALAPAETFDNDDRALAAIRTRLAPEFGDHFEFYQPEVRELWDPNATAAPAPASAPDDSSHLTGEAGAEQRAWLVRGSGGKRVPDWLDRGVCAIGFAESFPFTLEDANSKADLRARSDASGVDTTAGSFPNELGQVWRFVSAINVGDYVVTVNGQDVYLGLIAGPARSIGGRARTTTERDVEWLNAGEPIPRQVVEPAVYSKLKTLMTVSDITSVKDALSGWLTNAPTALAQPDVGPARVRLTTPTPALTDNLLLPHPWVAKVVSLLDEKRQIVLHGPPGTGKTHLALALAEALTADGGTTELVQFHPSYTYEDFFEGYRPNDGAGGTVTFALKPGPLRRIAEVALAEPGVPHVLVIDEINRANLAKVFGELYFLLEYRDRDITLQYSDAEFTLPDNLFVIGTMNTADRSIALVDAAMRRRFYFVEMSPNNEPVKGLLCAWLTKRNLSTEPADLLDTLNAALADHDGAIGPSFFMSERIGEPDVLERVWEHSIMPLLQERLYGASFNELARFSLEAIRTKTQATRQ